MATIPVKEFHDWDYSNPRKLTCKNHPTMVWYWKGPGRNLHFSGDSVSHVYDECPCPFSDLQVVVPDPVWIGCGHDPSGNEY